MCMLCVCTRIYVHMYMRKYVLTHTHTNMYVIIIFDAHFLLCNVMLKY